jgi:hypothetical protein
MAMRDTNEYFGRDIVAGLYAELKVFTCDIPFGLTGISNTHMPAFAQVVMLPRALDTSKMLRSASEHSWVALRCT